MSLFHVVELTSNEKKGQNANSFFANSEMEAEIEKSFFSWSNFCFYLFAFSSAKNECLRDCMSAAPVSFSLCELLSLLHLVPQLRQRAYYYVSVPESINRMEKSHWNKNGFIILGCEQMDSLPIFPHKSFRGRRASDGGLCVAMLIRVYPVNACMTSLMVYGNFYANSSSHSFFSPLRTAVEGVGNTRIENLARRSPHTWMYTKREFIMTFYYPTNASSSQVISCHEIRKNRVEREEEKNWNYIYQSWSRTGSECVMFISGWKYMRHESVDE